MDILLVNTGENQNTSSVLKSYIKSIPTTVNYCIKNCSKDCVDLVACMERSGL